MSNVAFDLKSIPTGVHKCAHCAALGNDSTLDTYYDGHKWVEDDQGVYVPTTILLMATCFNRGCPVKGTTAQLVQHPHVDPRRYSNNRASELLSNTPESEGGL